MTDVDALAAALHCFVPDSSPLPATADGPLAGVRAAVKDMIAVPGRTSSYGHPRWRATHAPAQVEAEALARLRAAGAAVVGFTKLDQLAYSLIGDVGEGEAPVNPRDPALFCGGSSSGSAAAVAGGVAELGVGTDTAGSIRVPAAACGLYSIRPTHGLVSTAGVLPLAPSLDVVGFLAREPALLDAALAAATTPPAGGALRRVLLPRDPSAYADADIAAAARATGLEVEPVDVGALVNAEVADLFARVQGREIWREHGAWAAAELEHLAPDVQARLRRCEALSRDSAAAIRADVEARDAYRRDVVELLGADTVLALPVLPRRGPLRAWDADELGAFRAACFRLTAPSSLGGVPEVVVPAGGGAAVGFVGPPGADRALLRLAGTVRTRSSSDGA
jgi:amidase